MTDSPLLLICKEFRFECAHALTGYDGKCRHLHGHSYRLLVRVQGRLLDKPGHPQNGMVMDFADLKRKVEEKVVTPFDHALVLQEGAPLASDMTAAYGKSVILPFPPTSEHLIVHFASLLAPSLPASVLLHSLRLYESATSYVEWHHPAVNPNTPA